MTIQQHAAQRHLVDIGNSLPGRPARPQKPRKPATVAGTDERFTANDYRYKLQKTAARLLPGEAVCKCGRCAVNQTDGVQIVRDGEGRAFARGLIRCKSVWHCPVCAAKIAEQRRAELVQLLAAWRADGGRVNMLTLTLPHNVAHDLADVLGALLRSWDLFNSGRNALGRVLEDIELVGQVRALEVTHGANGWHPHLHILLFTREQLLPAHIEYIQTRWAALLAARGFPTVRPDVAAQIQGGESAAEYISKTGWGMAEEIARSHTKKAGRGGRTPMQLLEQAALGCLKSSRLFVEYAEAFKGRKQIFISPALIEFAREHQAAPTEDDSAIIEAENIEVAEVVGYVTQADWSLLYRYDMRADLLHAVERNGAAGLSEVLEMVHNLVKFGVKPPPHPLEKTLKACKKRVLQA